MKIISIQVGKPRAVDYRGKPVLTGIFKAPVKGPLMLRATNLDGDGQADLKVHGGIDKALYAYSLDAYPAWKKQRPNDEFAPGAMGENLSLDKMPEDQIFIGDVFKVGKAIIQVTEPRFPCFKLGIKYNDPKIIKEFNELGRPGVYFRVLQEGLIDVGQTLELTSQEEVKVSVAELFAMKNAARGL